jgi:hypothetical protein
MCLPPLIWGRKQIQFPERHVFYLRIIPDDRESPESPETQCFWVQIRVLNARSLLRTCKYFAASQSIRIMTKNWLISVRTLLRTCKYFAASQSIRIMTKNWLISVRSLLRTCKYFAASQSIRIMTKNWLIPVRAFQLKLRLKIINQDFWHTSSFSTQHVASYIYVVSLTPGREMQRLLSIYGSSTAFT